MLINARTGDVVAHTIELADTRRARRRGLLGRASMAPSSALILLPCFSIHTAFVRFAIDAIFVDKDGTAVRLVHALGPWRAALSWRAHSVIELAAGSLRRSDICVGDRLYLARDHQSARASASPAA